MNKTARLWRERLSTAALLTLLANLAVWTGWLTLKNPLQLLRDSTPTTLKQGPDYIIEQFSVTRLSPSGSMTTQLVAPKLIHYPEHDSADLAFPQVVTRSLDGTVTQVRAHHGQLLRGGEQIELREAVHIVRTPNTPDAEVLTLRSEALTIFPDTEIIKSNVAIQASRGGSVIHAESMLLDNIRKTAEFSGKVESVIAAKKP